MCPLLHWTDTSNFLICNINSHQTRQLFLCLKLHPRKSPMHMELASWPTWAVCSAEGCSFKWRYPVIVIEPAPTPLRVVPLKVAVPRPVPGFPPALPPCNTNPVLKHHQHTHCARFNTCSKTHPQYRMFFMHSIITIYIIVLLTTTCFFFPLSLWGSRDPKVHVTLLLLLLPLLLLSSSAMATYLQFIVKLSPNLVSRCLPISALVFPFCLPCSFQSFTVIDN